MTRDELVTHLEAAVRNPPDCHVLNKRGDGWQPAVSVPKRILRAVLKIIERPAKKRGEPK